MKDEYKAIIDAGFTLQVDCPDLAMSRHNRFSDKSLTDFRDIVDMHVASLNEATKGLPAESMRLHLCWGNYEGPHHLDVPLKDIFDIVLKANANAISFEGANPRHEARVARLPRREAAAGEVHYPRRHRLHQQLRRASGGRRRPPRTLREPRRT